MPRRRLAREWLSRIGLIGFGLALSLALLEAALQLGAAVVRLTHESRGAAGDPDRFRIVCVGDSNTYGLYLARRESYPAQLERELAALRPDQPVEVVNLGAPGLSSSRLLRSFPEILEELAPDLVIVMLGANDLWTDPTAESPAPPTTLGGFLKRHSRVLRLFRLLRARGRADTEVAIVPVPEKGILQRADHWVRIGDHVFDFGFQHANREMPGADARLVENLERLNAAIQKSGARALFMTYPGRYALYGQANRAIRHAAHTKQLPLLDLTVIFQEPCPLEKCPTMLFEDQHPTARGYRLIAEQIAAWIQAHP
ncbi:MAG TPA: GDSL-type esterase/lipase family protein [Myxococcota bacterium]|jgi:lysophospholipase L1-like esterase